MAYEVVKSHHVLLDQLDFGQIQPLLDVVLANDPKQGAGDYAAYWLLRGKLDDRIAHFKEIAGKGPEGKKNWEILSHLYRAKGDLNAARDAADKAGEFDQAYMQALFDYGYREASEGRAWHMVPPGLRAARAFRQADDARSAGDQQDRRTQ